MKTPLIAGAALALALMTSGCVSVTAAPAGDYKLGAGYDITLPTAWNDVSAIVPSRPAYVRLLSLDGPLLNRLYLTNGLSPGQVLVKSAAKERPSPAYSAGMSPTELIEFVTDSVAAMDYQRVEPGAISPGSFAGGDGLRVDLTAKTKEGLDISGRAALAERGGKLYLILYLAPTEHYYAAHLGEVDAIMNSAGLKG